MDLVQPNLYIYAILFLLLCFSIKAYYNQEPINLSCECVIAHTAYFLHKSALSNTDICILYTILIYLHIVFLLKCFILMQHLYCVDIKLLNLSFCSIVACRI